MADSDDEKTRTHTMLTKGVKVAHYQIVEKIGAGGMGEVYLAEDTKLKRRIALKFMPAHMAADKDLRTRFTREAQAAAKLDHPNIVPVYEVGDFSGRPFIAMAHIDGEPLNAIIKQGKLSAAKSLDLCMQICEGLTEAHNAGIVHRDVKPSNIIVDKNSRARILDFGLATVSGEEKLTKAGSTLGTVGYMAPEQITGQNVDKRADIFSVGVILYEMITGKRPFSGDNDAATIRAITDSTPDPIARFKSGVSAELQQVIDRALAKDASIRYQSADGMLADLKRLNIKSTVPQSSKTRWLVVAAAAVLVAGYFISTKMMDSDSASSQAEAPVLIVLPFENLGAPEDEYFSNGIRDEICTRLSTVKGLRVISPRSADRYKTSEKTIEQIGQETGASYVMEGAISWDNSGEVSRFRINPRLTKTSDNYLMWSDNYERKLLHVFEVQAEIATQIVTALGLTLLEPGSQAPDYAPTTNMEAYNYYLRGLDEAGKGIWLGSLPSAIRMFDSAVTLDPNFAMAWAKKSVVHTQYEFGYIINNNSSHAIAAKEAAERALELDPQLSAGHIALGWYYNLIKRDYDKALSEFASAESEIMNNADLAEAIGVVRMRQGRWGEAKAELEKAARIDPLSVKRYYWLSQYYTHIREFDLAEQSLNRGLVLAPSDGDVIYFRIFLNLLKYGSVDSPNRTMGEIIGDNRIADVMSYELGASLTIGVWRYIMGRINPAEVIADLHNLSEDRSPFLIQLQIGQIYDLQGKEDSARVYYNSAKNLLMEYVDSGTDDFHVYSPLGLTFALLGIADSAIWAGKTAKEVMTVEDCHW